MEDETGGSIALEQNQIYFYQYVLLNMKFYIFQKGMEI